MQRTAGLRCLRAHAGLAKRGSGADSRRLENDVKKGSGADSRRLENDEPESKRIEATSTGRTMILASLRRLARDRGVTRGHPAVAEGRVRRVSGARRLGQGFLRNRRVEFRTDPAEFPYQWSSSIGVDIIGLASGKLPARVMGIPFGWLAGSGQLATTQERARSIAQLSASRMSRCSTTGGWLRARASLLGAEIPRREAGCCSESVEGEDGFARPRFLGSGSRRETRTEVRGHRVGEVSGRAGRVR